MFKKLLLATDDSVGGLVLRLTLAIVFFPHGAQKVLGWYGGPGFVKTIEIFTQGGAPAFVPVLLMAIEFLGPILLVMGLLTRLSALGIGGAMVVCVMKNHLQHGFFMNWYGTQKGEGYEFHILAIGIALALVLKGGGMLSVDRRLNKK